MTPRADSSKGSGRFTFKVFQAFFLISLFIFPFLFGSTRLWYFALGAGVLCAAFGAVWIDQLRRREPVLKTDLDLWTALYVLVFAASMILSKIPALSWTELFKLSVVLTAFFATRYFCRDRKQIYRLAQVFVFLGGALSIVGLLQFLGGLPNDWWAKRYFLSSMYVNHNHFAGLLVLILPITLGLLLAERDRPKKVLYIFLSTLMGIAFVFSLSRGALIALGVSMAWMMWILRRRRLISSIVVPFAVILVLVVCAAIIFGTESIEQRIENIRIMNEEEELSMRFRWLTWMGTLPMIAQFLWLGSGPGTFGHVFLQFRPQGGFSMRPVYAHNDHLHLLAEGGVLLFLAAAVWTFFFFRRGLTIIWRDESRLRIGVGTGVMAGILGMLVHALVDFNFHIPSNWLLAAVASALLFTLDEDKFYSLPRVSMAIKVAVSALLTAAMAACLCLGLSDYERWEAWTYLAEKDKKNALEAIERSLRLNPFDAESYYLRGLVRGSADDFEKAESINPYEPVYDLAKARLALSGAKDGSPERVIALFEEAIAKDPNNPTMGYVTAREFFGRNASGLLAPLRDAAGKMLSKRKETLAGLVSYLEKEGLWQHHRKYHLLLLGLDPDAQKKASPADLWNHEPSVVYTLRDFTQNGKEETFRDEMWYKNAQLKRTIEVRNSLVRIVLRAKGASCQGVFPAIYVRINGKIVDEHYMDSPKYKNYFTDLRLSPGTHVLTLEYVNDLRTGPLPGQDRTVWVQRVSLLEG